MVIDESTLSNYTSALNSYITFCRLHDRPIEPTQDTLSFYTVYMCHHIKPDSVDTYLSGICNQLEMYFPEVRKIRSSALVTKTLQGCKRLKGSPVHRKKALPISVLRDICQLFSTSSSHDDFLFCSLLCSGFYALLRLGELTYPDSRKLRNPRKVTKRSSVVYPDNLSYQFLLPSHKVDPFFEGNTIIVHRLSLRGPEPRPLFNRYLTSRDSLFPFNPELWLCSNGKVPTRSFFTKRLRRFCGKSMAGQSLRSGGATALAENGVLPHIIQGIGHWSSEAFRSYMRKSPVLIQAFLFPAPVSSSQDV
jgi:hypothetical protein